MVAAHTTEVWRPVVGFEGWYDVSNIGRVKRVRPGTHTRVGKILTPRTFNKYGHQRIGLSKNARTYEMLIHRMVLEAFVGPCPDGMECRHLDGNASNNCVENLAWGTRKEQQNDCKIHGTRRFGETHGFSKLTDDAVREIRRSREQDGTSYDVLAERFGVGKTTIARVVKWEYWRHVT